MPPSVVAGLPGCLDLRNSSSWSTCYPSLSSSLYACGMLSLGTPLPSPVAAHTTAKPCSLVWMPTVALGKRHEVSVLQVRQALPPYRGMVDAVKQIAREEGLAGFYRGLGPSLLLVRRCCTGVLCTCWPPCSWRTLTA